MREGTAIESWNHRITRELLRQAWPVAVSMLSYSCMTLVDTMFVSSLGASALAGVGVATIVTYPLIALPTGLMHGVKVLVSQAVGAGRRDHVGAYLGAGLALALVCGSLMAVLVRELAPLLARLSPSQAAAEHAAQYLCIRMLGAPVLFAFFALRETSYGKGNARAPMLASICANIVNIVGDYLFVVVWELGVPGVAWSSVASVCVEAALLFGVERHLVRAVRSARVAHLAAVIRVGLPTAGQYVLEVSAFSVLTAMIAAMAEAQMAAHQLVLHVLHVAFLPANAIAEAGAVLVGQAVGGKREDLVLHVARRALWVAGSYAVLCMVASRLGAPWLIRRVVDEPAVSATATDIIGAASLFLIGDATNLVARGVLRGVGDVHHTALVGIVFAWLVTPPLTWLLGFHAGMQARGGWIALCIEVTAGAALLWWRIGRGSWRAAASRTRDLVSQTESQPPG